MKMVMEIKGFDVNIPLELSAVIGIGSRLRGEYLEFMSEHIVRVRYCVFSHTYICRCRNIMWICGCLYIQYNVFPYNINISSLDIYRYILDIGM